jgi:hypothetical protein
MTELSSTTEAASLPSAVTSSDAAWVSLPVSFPPETLAALCKDVEVLFRLNPYYYFKVLRQTAPTTWIMEFENQSNQTHNTLTIEVNPGPGLGLTIHYDRGLKKRTIFTIEPAVHGGRLTVTDDYESLPEAERSQRLTEVDKSLTAWGEALRLYFLRLKRWSWLPGWRWYIRHLWLPMKPSSRRIVWWLYLFTVAEFFFFLFVLLIFNIEQQK